MSNLFNPCTILRKINILIETENKYPLSEAEKSFIKAHQNDEVTTLLLQAKKYPNLNIPDLVLQIKARQKAKIKLPEWFENEGIIFPKMLSVEQSSSEITAKFKSNLVLGKTLIDLTGGMGVDIAYMSKNFKKAIYFEQNADLLNVTKYNFKQLGIENVEFVGGDSVEKLSEATQYESGFKGLMDFRIEDEKNPKILKSYESQFRQKNTWIYLDPHRRDDTGSKVVRLQDCEPNILKIKDLLFKHTDNILLKASPMLDIDLAILDLGNASQVYVVAVENEVKEVLFHLEKNVSEDVILNAVNLTKNNSTTLSFTKSKEKNANISLGSPKQYLYEPNAAIMKSGAFRFIAQFFDLQKIAPHSHLYTSEKLVENFQGRIFKIVAVCKLDKKEISKHLSENKANITIRNFPLTVQQIRDKLKLSDGGNEYLFATTDAQNQKIVIICRKN
jgi:16S rRNA G966 N2-methylase RsmD